MKKKHKAPGKSFRKGLTLVDLMSMFPDEESALAWFNKTLWANGPVCPYCGSLDVQSGIRHHSMTHRCRDCPDKKMFSIRTGTLMENSNLPFRVWAISIYLHLTNLKGVSSMKLHRDLGVTQKSAWFVLQRIRAAWKDEDDWPFGGPVEVDESYLGGIERNRHESRKGAKEKAIVIGAKDRATKKIRARVIEFTDKPTLHGFVSETAHKGATIYTDGSLAYLDIPFPHESVNHSVGEYVRGMAHTNGIESFWAMLKRGYYGTYHRMSFKHLGSYVNEFAGRHNIRRLDTIDQMTALARKMIGKRLKYQDLIA